MNCPICKTLIEDEDFLRSYFFLYNNQEYKLYHCLKCDLQFWYPLKIFPELYENEVFKGYIEMHIGERKIPEWQKIFVKNFLDKKGSLLDVGCGNGVFIKEMEKIGFNVYGIDFDSKNIKIAKEKYNLKNVYSMSLELFVPFAEQNNLKFDIITFFEVLEHQDNPVSFVSSIKKLLKPEGYITGSVPDRRRPFVEKERTINNTDFPPHHFLWFNKKSLEYLLKKEGFTEIKFYPVRFGVWYYASFLEATLLGEFGKKIKLRLKNFFIKPKNGKELIYSVDTLQRIHKDNNKLWILQLLRLIRSLIFLPLAVILFPYYFMNNGHQIYFQAKF
ncbi:MAG: class I SAM-dependent methyltransferase [Candidatus Pacebacteria bacterium]|nr:class I SAM-dependent methyltransferase [Candidatus Paceibacterota bacterium]